MPAVPQDVLLLKEELSKRYSNTVRVTNLISLDADNLTLFLKITNACLDKEELTIVDAREAVNIIGLGDVFNFYMSSVLSRKLLDNKGEEHILNQSLRVGIVTAELSYWVYEVSRSEAFMLGLLEDIGTIFLLRKESDYQVIMDKMVSFPFTQFEKEVLFFETDHGAYPIVPLKPFDPTGDFFPSVLAGLTCDSIDVVAEDIELPELEVGDILICKQMGTYTIASATEFNYYPKPKVVVVEDIFDPETEAL